MKRVYKLIIVIGLISYLNATSYSQFIDYYGFSLGSGLSFEGSNLVDQGPKIGFELSVIFEKRLNNLLGLRMKTGYIHKGFRSELITNSNEQVFDNISYHNLTSDIGLKLLLVKKSSIHPYLIGGFKFNYLLDYKNFDNKDFKSLKETYADLIDSYNKFTIDGLIGLGVEFKSTVFFEIDFYPGLSNKSDNSNNVLKVRDSYIGISIGLNINQIVKKDK